MMRSQSRFSEENTIGELKVDTEGVERAIAGEHGARIIEGKRGISVISSYSPVQIEGLNWIILAEMEEAEAFQGVSRIRHMSLIIGAISIGVIIWLALMMGRKVLRQLGSDPVHLAQVADSIAGGHYDMDLSTGEKKASGVFASMQVMQANLRERIQTDRRIAAENGRIKQALDQVDGNVMISDRNGIIIYYERCSDCDDAKCASGYTQRFASFRCRQANRRQH